MPEVWGACPGFASGSVPRDRSVRDVTRNSAPSSSKTLVPNQYVVRMRTFMTKPAGDGVLNEGLKDLCEKGVESWLPLVVLVELQIAVAGDRIQIGFQSAKVAASRGEVKANPGVTVILGSNKVFRFKARPPILTIIGIGHFNKILIPLCGGEEIKFIRPFY